MRSGLGVGLGDEDVAPDPGVVDVRATVCSSKPFSRSVPRYRSMRRFVSSFDWMFIRNGRPARACRASIPRPRGADDHGVGFV